MDLGHWNWVKYNWNSSQLENSGKLAAMLGETHFDDKGQESDPMTMDFAVMIEDHGVHSRTASYQKLVGEQIATSYV